MSIHGRFRYFQLRSFVRINFPSFPKLPEKSLLENIMSSSSNNIRSIYNLLLFSQVSSLSRLRDTWEKELGLGLDEDYLFPQNSFIYTFYFFTFLNAFLPHYAKEGAVFQSVSLVQLLTDWLIIWLQRSYFKPEVANRTSCIKVTIHIACYFNRPT